MQNCNCHTPVRRPVEFLDKDGLIYYTSVLEKNIEDMVLDEVSILRRDIKARIDELVNSYNNPFNSITKVEIGDSEFKLYLADGTVKTYPIPAQSIGHIKDEDFANDNDIDGIFGK